MLGDVAAFEHETTSHVLGNVHFTMFVSPIETSFISFNKDFGTPQITSILESQKLGAYFIKVRCLCGRKFYHYHLASVHNIDLNSHLGQKGFSNWSRIIQFTERLTNQANFLKFVTSGSIPLTGRPSSK